MEAIYIEYKQEVMKCPSTSLEWKEVADGFYGRWQYPNCLGALDGKHIRIRCPPKSGSDYHNYKHFFSFALMALVDYQYCFLYIHVGQPGSNSDGGIFSRTNLYDLIVGGAAGISDPAPLPNDDHPISYHIVGDEAFALNTWMMKPYPKTTKLTRTPLKKRQQVFNYRLSRGRRVSENAFGILSTRFRCFLSPMEMLEKNAIKVVLGCCTLHNNLCERNDAEYLAQVDTEELDSVDFIPGAWRTNRAQNTFDALRAMQGQTGTRVARIQRDYLMQYFNGEAGRVEWQERYIARQEEDEDILEEETDT